MFGECTVPAIIAYSNFMYLIILFIHLFYGLIISPLLFARQLNVPSMEEKGGVLRVVHNT